MPAPQLLSIGVNEGEGVFIQVTPVGQPSASYPVTLAGQQSVVRHLRLTFDLGVVLDLGAVTLTPKTGVQVVSGTLQPSAVAPSTAAHPLPGSNGRTWIITFSGPGSDPISGAIDQGVYNVAIDPAKVKFDGTPMAAATSPITFWTMFGGQSFTGTTLVKATLDATMGGAFGANVSTAGPPAYTPFADGNLDGKVDGIDRIKADAAAGTVWVF